jgi:hypothetical protein
MGYEGWEWIELAEGGVEFLWTLCWNLHFRGKNWALHEQLNNYHLFQRTSLQYFVPNF